MSSEDRLVEHAADGFGAGLLDTGSGAASETKIWDRRSAIRAHGVLMSVAWVLLLPLGSRLPAHRWVLAGRTWRGTALWFWLHVGMQVAGLATFLAGLLVAFLKLSSPKSTTEVAGQKWLCSCAQPWRVLCTWELARCRSHVHVRSTVPGG